MHTTFFKNLSSPKGKAKEFRTFEEFYTGYLDKFSLREKKDGELFSLCSFSNNYRNNSNAEFFSGAVLDFDNKDEAGEMVDPPDTPDTIYDELEGTECAFYSTWSHTLEWPRFRLVIPFKKPVSVQHWPRVFNAIVEMLGFPPGLDVTCQELSRSYFLPACLPKNEEFIFADYYKGEPLDAFELAEIEEKVYLGAEPPLGVITPISKSKSKTVISNYNGHGRNNALRAQACACLEKKVSLEEAILQLVEFDKANHNPPLFEDPTENVFVEGYPAAGAMKFVSSVWFTHAKKGDAPRIGHISLPGDNEPEEEKEPSKFSRKEIALPDKLAEACPGLVGEIAHWMTSTAPKPQPALSLGAALAAVGVVKGHRVMSETGLRTNHYILGLGASGSGKEHPSRLTQLLFQQSGFANLFIGEPASDSGLVKAVYENQGKGLLVWDEIGHAILAMTSRSAPAHEKKLVKVMTEMFSKANSVFRGKEFAVSRDDRKDLDQPCLCIFGTTVPERFYEALSSRDAKDGFLPRWLVMHVENNDVKRKRRKQVEDVPKEFKEALIKIGKLSTNQRAQGGVDKAMRIRPGIMLMEPAADRLAVDIEEEFDRMRLEARKEGDGLDAVWNRGFEHTIKVAITICDGRVTKPVLDYSFRLVNHCLRASCAAFLEHTTQNAFDREAKRIFSIIQRSGDLSRTQLYKKAKLPTSELSKITSYLEGTGQIKHLEEKTAGRKREMWSSRVQ